MAELGVTLVVDGAAAAPHRSLADLLRDASGAAPGVATTAETPAFPILVGGPTSCAARW